MLEKLLLVILDGVGHREETHGNAVHAAHTPSLAYLQQHGLFTTLKAHGTWIGMPADDDLGNSEVGHTTLGAGRTFDQGAKLVDNAIASGALFKGRNWRQAVKEHHHQPHRPCTLSGCFPTAMCMPINVTCTPCSHKPSVTVCRGCECMPFSTGEMCLPDLLNAMSPNCNNTCNSSVMAMHSLLLVGGACR